MLNSAVCRSKTPLAPAGALYCEKSSRSKSLIQGRRLCFHRTCETSRHVFVHGSGRSIQEEFDDLNYNWITLTLIGSPSEKASLTCPKACKSC